MKIPKETQGKMLKAGLLLIAVFLLIALVFQTQVADFTGYSNLAIAKTSVTIKSSTPPGPGPGPGGGGGGGGGGFFGCKKDSDCSIGKVCDKKPSVEYGRCVVGCRVDANCTFPDICEYNNPDVNYGQCGPGCRIDDDCEQYHICEDKRCILGCRETPKCPPGNMCNIFPLKDYGLCEPSKLIRSGTCLVNEDCAPDQNCVVGDC